MLFQAVLATALTLPILSTCTHNLKDTSDVFYFDQLPPESYDNDSTVAEYKDKIYVRKDISFFSRENGPSLTCLPDGKVTLGFTNGTAFRLNELADQKFLGHPVIIPHNYDTTSCPELVNHTIYGPRSSIPPDTLTELEEGLEAGNYAVMIAHTEDDVQEQNITLSVDWVTYHELIGAIGNPPEELSFLAQGVLPWSSTTSSASGSTGVEKRRFRLPPFRIIAPILREGGRFLLDQIANEFGG